MENIIDKFCIIGNSHLSQFSNKNLNIIYGYGASICGLYNNNSTLNLKQNILNYQEQNPEKHLVFFLGQSDIEFIYYYKSIKNNIKLDINVFIDDIIYNYLKFIKKNIKNPIIMGINPTVIESNIHIFKVNFKDTGTITNLNPIGKYNEEINYDDVKHFYDDFNTRFKNNLLFNTKLKIECEKNNIKYFDINDEVLDDNNNVKHIYLPNNDHHLIENINLYNHLIYKLKNFIK
jgi:hypothetical protein